MAAKEEFAYIPGDLVRYYEFKTQEYGEGTVTNKGMAIVIEVGAVKWDDRVQQWIDNARWHAYNIIRYKILCLDTGRKINVGYKALELISRVTTTNNQQQ